MSKEIAIVYVCRNYKLVENAIKALRKSGCDLRGLSVVGKDHHPLDQRLPTEGGKKASDIVSFWCRMWNILAGDAFMVIPGFGSVLVAGPLARHVMEAWTSLEAFESLRPLDVSLFKMGVSHESITRYENALRSDYYLLIIHGTPGQVAKVKGALEAAVDPQGLTPDQLEK